MKTPEMNIDTTSWAGERLSEFQKVAMAYAFWDPAMVLDAFEHWRYEGVMN